MREILFRGKLIGNGEWVEGYYAKAKDIISEKDLHIIFHTDLESFPRSEFSGYDVVTPDTIGQYTGLTDKNGRRIFEGDIIKMSDGEIGAVAYSDDCAGYDLTRGGCTLCLSQTNERLVIGNIHDNPELLEEA